MYAQVTFVDVGSCRVCRLKMPFPTELELDNLGRLKIVFCSLHDPHEPNAGHVSFILGIELD